MRAVAGAMSNPFQQAFAVSLAKWTIGFWVAVYVVLTFRSVLTPQLPFGTLAMLRLPMMFVGVAVCVALFALFARLDRSNLLLRAVAIPPLIASAALVYSAVNFQLFYSGSGLFVPPGRALTKIYSYLIEFIWIFAAWTALYYAARNRASAILPQASAPARGGIWIRDGGSSLYLHLGQVRYVEAERDYVRIHTSEGSHLVRATMVKMEERLKDADFVRIHRSVIAPRRDIRRIGRNSNGRLVATLASGAVLPVGRVYLDTFRNGSRQSADNPLARG